MPRKRIGIRKPSGIRQADWDSYPDHLKNKIIRKREEREAKANLLNPADFAKGIVAAEAGLPMDIMQLFSPGGGMSWAERFTKMQPSGTPGYEEYSFLPQYKHTTPDLYHRMGGTPGSGSGLAGELLAPGAMITAPFMGLSKGKKILDRVFKAGERVFTSGPINSTVELIGKVQKDIEKGKTNVARIDKTTGEPVINIDYLLANKFRDANNKEQILYNKKDIEYSGFREFLEEEKKKGSAIPLTKVQEFWDKNNLDIRETWFGGFTSSYNLEGGTNQRSLAISYHGKQRPMSQDSLEKMNEISQHEYKKDFDELSSSQQQNIEMSYSKWYKDDATLMDRSRTQVSQMFEDDTSQMHHGKPNILFHMRMDDRMGVGDQTGEKILNVFEIQSDWYARANREGIYNLEAYDDKIAELLRENTILEQQKTPNSSVSELAEIHTKQEANEKASKKLSDELRLVRSEMENQDAAPKAPFVMPGKQEEWLGLALKRILKLAVDEGYDRITFGSREIQGKIYPGSVTPVHEFKVEKIKRSEEIKLPKKVLNPDGSIKSSFTITSGEKKPYYVRPYDIHGNLISGPNPEREIRYYNEETLRNMFGDTIFERIKSKAKTGRSTKVKVKEGETPDYGLENLNVLYDITLPSIIKKPPFNKYNLELEQVPMGMEINRSEIQAANQQFTIDENFLRDRGITVNDQGGDPTFTYTNTNGNEITAPIEGLLASAEEGLLAAPPGGIDVDSIRTAARNIQERLEFGIQGSLQNLPAPVPSNTSGFVTMDELVNPGGFINRVDRYQHPLHRTRASADARQQLEDKGITFNINDDGSIIWQGPNDVHTSSSGYLEDYRSTGGDLFETPPEVKLMREIEITNILDQVELNSPRVSEESILVDRQYLNLMDPETREVELSHVEGALGSRNIKVLFDPETGRPKFNWADSPSADKWSANEMVNRGVNDIQYNLMKRYEVAGSPNVPKEEVLDVTRAEVMPFHLSQDMDGNLPWSHDEWLENRDIVHIEGVTTPTNQQILPPGPPVLTDNFLEISPDTPPSDIVSRQFNSNPTVTNARENLEELGGGIRIAWHSEAPYLSFSSDDLLSHAEDMGPGEIPTSYRGVDDFLQALDDGDFGPNAQWDEDEIRHYVRIINDRVRPDNFQVPNELEHIPLPEEGPDVQYTGLNTGQQALTAPPQSIPINEINFQEVMESMNQWDPSDSRNRQIFDSLRNSAQVDLVGIKAEAKDLYDRFGIEVDISSPTPAFIMGDNSYTAEGISDFDWHDLTDGEIANINEYVENIVVGNERLRESVGNNLQLIGLNEPAGLLTQQNVQPSLTKRAVGDQPKQWSVKLTDKLKEALKEGPMPYGLIPPGILAAQAANQQQSLLE